MPVKLEARSGFLRRCFCLLLLLQGLFADVSAQKFLPDTFFVDLKADTIIELHNIAISRIEDRRNEDPRFVQYLSKNKFVLVPVDQEVYLRRPLADEIIKNISNDTSRSNVYALAITKFVIEKQEHRFSKPTVLVADIPVYKNTSGSLIYLGTLYYDYQYLPERKKESLEVATENLLHEWHRDFKIDMISLRATSGDAMVVQNFIANENIRSLYLNARIDGFAGYNWWGIQGELNFSRPETNSRSVNTGSVIRYIQNSDYESFAIGKKSEHAFFRRSENTAFDVDLNILLGFCKWKDIETEAPTLYQIFDFQLSSIQSFMLNPLNRKGMIFRLGIIENISYVIGKNPKLQVGGVIGIGVKI
jgi:hypothetical protein